MQAALKAAVEGLAMGGGLEERQATPGMLLVPLLRHQRIALAWMARRETGASAPWGGILADDQVCPTAALFTSLCDEAILHSNMSLQWSAQHCRVEKLRVSARLQSNMLLLLADMQEVSDKCLGHAPI